MDNLDGPVHTLDKSEVFKITYSNGKTDVLGKHRNAEETKSLIVSKINEFGADRDRSSLSLQTEFYGNDIKISSINTKGNIVHEGDLWILAK